MVGAVTGLDGKSGVEGKRMRLDERISAIINETKFHNMKEKQAEWMWKNLEEALKRARKLENLAEAVSAVSKDFSD